ncbi:hypothetical protein KIH23_02730 [Flavobacterium sp. CYK-55]|uniref:hypothetical protein n=1 Tax=Flavobacterium sp. CYK-55 TaxID=2835529 RepID=UPI001BCEEA4E|nr:hypothetical protein [Flavobacterium sp. CYK-55]MBS7786199.1 hypothetical protein [Flavobacterium sp. CYK-55]
MKKGVVYFLLFIFTIQSTKSLWIISSFQINREYIANNICINRFDKIPVCKGQCYLNNELNKEQKENKKSLTTIEKEVLYTAPEYITLECPKIQIFTTKEVIGFKTDATYFSFLNSVDDPPELVS